MIHLFVFEEDSMMRDLIRELFAGQEVSITTASTIVEALEVLSRGEHFDAAIVDCFSRVEHRRADDVVDALRRDGCSLIVAVSGSSQHLAAMMATGCQIGMLKPFVTGTAIVAAVMHAPKREFDQR